MSITEALGRITTIQSTLAQVSGASQRTAAGTGTATATASSSNTAASAASVAAQLAATTLAGSAAGVAGGTGTTGADAFSGALATALKQDPATATGAKRTGAADEVGPVKKHGSTTGADVVATAKKYLGVPYVWGGNNPAIGLDCSSLVQHTFRDLGIDLPRVARQQATVGTEVPSLAQAKPGDLLVLRNGKHIGIYLGDNQMIHAPRPGAKVSIRELFEKDKDIMTIRRIVPAEAPAAAAPALSTSNAAALALQQAAFAGASS